MIKSPKSQQAHLTARYVFALTVVAVLASSSYLLLGSQIRSQEATGAVINVAGKQRMLSQRAPRLLLEVLTAPDEASALARRDDLEKTIATMLKDHRGLVDGDAERGLPGEYPDEMAAMYHGEGQLDARMTEFVGTLQELSRMPKSQLATNPALFAALDASRKALLGDLNQVVGMYEESSETSVGRLQSTQTALLAVMLLTLAAIGFTLFRPMVRQIRDQVQALLERERDMRLVLENARDGLLLVDPKGGLLGTKSQAALDWFGEPEPAQRLWDYLFSGEPERSAMLEMGWGELSEGFLPIEVTVDQLPGRFEREGRTYSLGYTPLLGADEAVTHVLVSVSDITEELALVELERRSHEVQNFVRYTVRDRVGAESFVEETERLLDVLEAVEGTGDSLLLRTLHTIKGNAAVHGLDSLTQLAHGLEDRVEEEPETVTGPGARQTLQSEWEAFMEEIGVFLSGSTTGVQLLDDEYNLFFRDVCGHGDDQLIKSVRSWRQPRMHFALHRLERQAHRLAEQLGRELEVIVDDNCVRTDAEDLQGFWSSMVHVLRNAVDHGIEEPETRSGHGKPRAGRIQLRSTLQDGELIVEVIDDGRGIDWESVRERALSMGLRADSHKDLTEALLHDGLSTRQEVSTVSGRGVGMAVLSGEVKRCNGRIELESAVGEGTHWRFVFPRTQTKGEQELLAAIS